MRARSSPHGLQFGQHWNNVSTSSQLSDQFVFQTMRSIAMDEGAVGVSEGDLD